MDTARYIVEQLMLKNDPFSKFLGMELLEIRPGHCKLSLVVTEVMLNGFRIAHGGILFSLADSAMAFAANAGGYISYSKTCTLQFKRKVQLGDVVIAHAKCIKSDDPVSTYEVHIAVDEGTLLAIFSGEVHTTNKRFEILG